MEIEHDFIYISDDEIAEAQTDQVKETALTIMTNNLKDYINKMGEESNFKGWIAYICPENVTVDKRLEIPNSEWHALWNKEIEYYKSLNKNKLNIVSSNKSKKYNHIYY